MKMFNNCIDNKYMAMTILALIVTYHAVNARHIHIYVYSYM